LSDQRIQSSFVGSRLSQPSNGPQRENSKPEDTKLGLDIS
jgi:hypothetical protein